jgi:hypothetical protein
MFDSFTVVDQAERAFAGCRTHSVGCCGLIGPSCPPNECSDTIRGTKLYVCRIYPCGEVGFGLKDAMALRELGLSSVFYAAYSVAVESVIAVVFWAVGVVIFWRNSQDKMAVFSAFILVT